MCDDYTLKLIPHPRNAFSRQHSTLRWTAERPFNCQCRIENSPWFDIHSGRDQLAFLAGEGMCVFISARVCVCECVFHCKLCRQACSIMHIHSECAHVRWCQGLDVQLSLSRVQSFPTAALDQRAWVKRWTWSGEVWKNLDRNNYNLSKYQTHACSPGPQRRTHEPGRGTFSCGHCEREDLRLIRLD